MPIVPRPAVDPAVAIAPNASPAGGAGPHDADAATATEFAAALSLLLGLAAKPAAAATATQAGVGVRGRSPGSESGESETKAAGSSDESPDGTAGTSEAPPDAPPPSHGTASPTAGERLTHQSSHAPAELLGIPSLTSAPGQDGEAADAPIHNHPVTRTRDLLNPAFRDRLERVIARMESEFGYKVDVVETYRSQTRQDALFAQGRTEPGQVVTWTRSSNHTAGRAADLVIDGSYDSALPYERLMRIAHEEGLRTLGPRDPGHVELPSSAATEATPIIARVAPSVASTASIVAAVPELEHAAEPAPMTMPPIAGVARVATVAPVAQVAQVAPVAQVATVGAHTAPVVHAGSRSQSTDAASSRAATRRNVAAADATTPAHVEQPNQSQAVAPATLGEKHAGDSGRHDKGEPNDDRARTHVDTVRARDGAAEVMRQTRDDLMRAVAGADPNATSSTLGTGDNTSAPIGHADMSERIARLLKVQDAAAERPMSQVTLRLERPDGGEDRLRVDLRGHTVSATLDVSDPSAADRLSANVKELQRSLERQGLQTDSLTVRTAARSLEPSPLSSSTLSRAAGASVESDLQRTVGSSSPSSTNTSSRERGARHDGERPSPDPQRQRSRREHKGDR